MEQNLKFKTKEEAESARILVTELQKYCLQQSAVSMAIIGSRFKKQLLAVNRTLKKFILLFPSVFRIVDVYNNTISLVFHDGSKQLIICIEYLFHGTCPQGKACKRLHGIADDRFERQPRNNTKKENEKQAKEFTKQQKSQKPGMKKTINTPSINKMNSTPASNNNNNNDTANNNNVSAVIQVTHKRLSDPVQQQNDDTLMTLQDAIQNDHSIKWVRTCTDVQEVIKCFEGLSIVAVDTEHYNEKIVILQIFTGQVTLLFDFMVGENDHKELVSCLSSIMHDSSICKVFHDCRKDVLYLRDLGITDFAALSDTQVLHQLNLDLKGRKDRRIGLGDLLVLHQLEHKSKAEVQKKIKTINWSLRPLSEELIRYVAEDVVYLIELYNKLEEQRKKLTQAICDSYSTSKLANNNNIAPKPKRNDLENSGADWLKFHKHDSY